MRRSLKRLIAILALLPCSATAMAQLSVASGRSIALSQPQWRLFIPDDYTHRAGEAVDLLVHFHGDPQTVWNNAAYAELNAVVLTVNYSGLSSAYSTPFSNTALFQTVLDDARSTLASEPDFATTTSWNRLAVSSFSAGYGAVRQILAVPSYFTAIDSLLAAEGLSDDTREELEDYKQDITNGDFTEADSQYLRALAKRLSGGA